MIDFKTFIIEKLVEVSGMEDLDVSQKEALHYVIGYLIGIGWYDK